MKTLLIQILLAGLCIAPMAFSQDPFSTLGVPAKITYQGRVVLDDTGFDGDGYFAFALLEDLDKGPDDDWKMIWNNWQGLLPLPVGPPDAGDVAGHEITVPVSNGSFSIQLGRESALEPGAIGVESFWDRVQDRPRGSVLLRVWFSPDLLSFVQLDPDCEIASVPYAAVAGIAHMVEDGGIVSDTLERQAVLTSLDPGTSLFSRNPVDVEMQSLGFVRESQAFPFGATERHLYRKETSDVHRLGLVSADGIEVIDGQDAPLSVVRSDAQGDLSLGVRNLGNRQLTGLQATFDGMDPGVFSASFDSTEVSPGEEVTLTVSLGPGAGTPRSLADLHVSASELAETFDAPLVGVHVGFVQIPGAAFTMGRTSGDTDADAPPVSVTMSSFAMQTTEVTKAQWDAIRNWALLNGYDYLWEGSSKRPDHPVYSVSWRSVVKWCNAWSEMEGLTPAYYSSDVHSPQNVLRTGQTDLEHSQVKWDADGYRLPTEAEWEMAARGGVIGKRYPWGSDTISHSQANYRAYLPDYGNQSGNAGYHPAFDDGVPPFSSPVGSFAPTGNGLYDMAGNMNEWCWDWYASDSYAAATDPRGPVSGTSRVVRGGATLYPADNCRAGRRDQFNPANGTNQTGFRVVFTQVP